jgi:hypothetical protein
MSALQIIFAVQSAVGLAVSVWASLGRLRYGTPSRAYALRIACATVIVTTAYPMARLINLAMDGCYPWSPEQVPYHPGMILCPGQSTSVNFIIRAPVPTIEPATEQGI